MLSNTPGAGVQVPDGMWLRAEGKETQPRGWAWGCGQLWRRRGRGQSRDIIILNRLSEWLRLWDSGRAQASGGLSARPCNL